MPKKKKTMMGGLEPVSIKETVDGAKKLFKGFFPSQQEKTELKQKKVEALGKEIEALQTERKLNLEIQRLKNKLKEEKRIF